MSIAMNGGTFPYLAPAVYYSLGVDEVQEVTIDIKELPQDRKTIIEKVLYYSAVGCVCVCMCVAMGEM